ncbi:MAG: MBL fold metallo-hydrolase [Eubacterium sp.]|nr:MBL fold metallo-hydrolase [Eubacterium sp.]
MELEIKNILVGELYTNCYIVKNKATGEGFIVDPGDDDVKIFAHIAKMEMTPMAILLTHGHIDHMGAAEALKERYQIPIYVSEKEEQVLLNPTYNLSAILGSGPRNLCADHYLKDGEKIQIAGVELKFILTPGHTQGSGCYYIKDANLLFSGDTLFCASRGRTDFPGGSEAQIVKSIREKLLLLPEETDVLAGHMEQTTIGDEKRFY